VLAAAALTGCSGGSGTNSAAADAKEAGSSASPSVTPGKYRILPEPCGSVGESTLKALLPVSDDYGGQATLTYDTDRRVGCKWSGKTDGGGRNLSIDIERTVSYDPAVSDEDQAREDYDDKAVAAGLPMASTSASASTSPSTSASPSSSASASASPSASASESASASASDSAPVGPRVLSDLGNSAFLDDVLATSGLHRDVTVVFRKANVLVTVVFSEWSTDNSVTPGSQELQDGARKVAGEISGQFR
jgi:hypothetical protein